MYGSVEAVGRRLGEGPLFGRVAPSIPQYILRVIELATKYV
jgi:hypothetical protein